VVGLAGCGGDDGPRLSRAGYTKRASAECTALGRTSDALQQAQAPGATGEQVSDYLTQAAGGLQALADGLDALRPPEAIEADADSLSAALADYGDGLQSLADEVGSDDRFQDALGANQDLVRELNDIAERAARLVAKLGIDGCQLAA
ncbi:MAG: hypothetical protein MUP67_11440, partial [Acidimicrobiia bacterium]|nr:hypothetical protein [Acidimicrobiia bacterium]